MHKEMEQPSDHEIKAMERLGFNHAESFWWRPVGHEDAIWVNTSNPLSIERFTVVGLCLDIEWLLRSDDGKGYFANVFATGTKPNEGAPTWPERGPHPTATLLASIARYMEETGKI